MRRKALGVALASSALLLAACGGSSATPNASSGKVTLTWWHNATQDPLKSYFQQVADAYTKAHPNVTFNISPIQNETIDTKIQVALQSNNAPDIFQQWGGGELAQQVQSGKVQDISSATSATVAGMGGSTVRGANGRGALRGRMAGRRQAVRRPVQPWCGRVLVPH